MPYELKPLGDFNRFPAHDRVENATATVLIVLTNGACVAQAILVIVLIMATNAYACSRMISTA